MYPKKLGQGLDWIKGNIKVLLVSYILGGLASRLYYGYEPKYIEALGASALTIGLINSAVSLIRTLVIIPGSIITDTYGRKKIIVVFSFFSASSLLIYAISPNWKIFFLGMTNSSVYRIYYPALDALEADSIPEEKRGEGYSLVNLVPGLAGGLTPPIAGYIIARMGFISGMRLNYFIAFILVLAMALTRFLGMKETYEAGPVDKSLWEASLEGVRGLFEIWNDLPDGLWVLMLLMLLKASLIPFFGVYVSLYVLNVVGIGSFEWGLVGSSYMLIGLILGLPFGRLVDRFGRWWVMLLSFVFSLPFLVFMMRACGFVLVLGLFLVRSVGELLWYPSVGAAQADLVPVEKRGRIMGLSGLMIEGISVVSSALFGFLYSIDPFYSFYCAIVIEIFCVILVLIQLNR
jgi:MFS family permease